MRIRPVTTHDRKEIVRLLRQRGTFNQREIRVALDVIDEALERPEKGDYHAFCARDGNANLAGYICFGPIPMTDGCYDLYWIAVDERMSKKGIGGKLLAFMEEFLVREGARRIYVDTSSTPHYKPARSFYKKHGYHVACLLKDFYREGDHKVIFMKEVSSSV
ncbi:MAG: GNAT family N-acetyltransferase [Deltaproteobacteria bacterium]|nr:MAG: GNAT family N-acetyltransferase [Deltaproteobacteria bacterium]